MGKYPLIEKIGLFIWKANSISEDHVDAKELESALEKATVLVTDQLDPKTSWFDPEQWALFSYENPGIKARHQGLLICVEEIKKESVKVEFEALVTQNLAGINAQIKRSELIPYIGKRVKVTVEELP